MISIFGIVSVAVALICVAIIVLHNRVMNKRTPVDEHLAALEDLLREKIENLYNTSHADSELRVLCGQCVDLDLNSMLKALPDIDIVADDLQTNDYEANQKIQETIAGLNQVIDEYNRFIIRNLPVNLMAQALGLTAEEPIKD